jgi:hypothetical protein
MLYHQQISLEAFSAYESASWSSYSKDLTTELRRINAIKSNMSFLPSVSATTLPLSSNDHTPDGLMVSNPSHVIQANQSDGQQYSGFDSHRIVQFHPQLVPQNVPQNGPDRSHQSYMMNPQTTLSHHQSYPSQVGTQNNNQAKVHGYGFVKRPKHHTKKGKQPVEQTQKQQNQGNLTQNQQSGFGNQIGSQPIKSSHVTKKTKFKTTQTKNNFGPKSTTFIATKTTAVHTKKTPLETLTTTITTTSNTTLTTQSMTHFDLKTSSLSYMIPTLMSYYQQEFPLWDILSLAATSVATSMDLASQPSVEQKVHQLADLSCLHTPQFLNIPPLSSHENYFSNKVKYGPMPCGNDSRGNDWSEVQHHNSALQLRSSLSKLGQPPHLLPAGMGASAQLNPANTAYQIYPFAKYVNCNDQRQQEDWVRRNHGFIVALTATAPLAFHKNDINYFSGGKRRKSLVQNTDKNSQNNNSDQNSIQNTDKNEPNNLKPIPPQDSHLYNESGKVDHFSMPISTMGGNNFSQGDSALGKNRTPGSTLSTQPNTQMTHLLQLDPQMNQLVVIDDNGDDDDGDGDVGDDSDFLQFTCCQEPRALQTLYQNRQKVCKLGLHLSKSNLYYTYQLHIALFMQYRLYLMNQYYSRLQYILQHSNNPIHSYILSSILNQHPQTQSYQNQYNAEPDGIDVDILVNHNDINVISSPPTTTRPRYGTKTASSLLLNNMISVDPLTETKFGKREGYNTGSIGSGIQTTGTINSEKINQHVQQVRSRNSSVVAKASTFSTQQFESVKRTNVGNTNDDITPSALVPTIESTHPTRRRGPSTMGSNDLLVASKQQQQQQSQSQQRQFDRSSIGDAAANDGVHINDSHPLKADSLDKIKQRRQSKLNSTLSIDQQQKLSTVIGGNSPNDRKSDLSSSITAEDLIIGDDLSVSDLDNDIDVPLSAGDDESNSPRGIKQQCSKTAYRQFNSHVHHVHHVHRSIGGNQPMITTTIPQSHGLPTPRNSPTHSSGFSRHQHHDETLTMSTRSHHSHSNSSAGSRVSRAGHGAIQSIQSSLARDQIAADINAVLEAQQPHRINGDGIGHRLHHQQHQTRQGLGIGGTTTLSKAVFNINLTDVVLAGPEYFNQNGENVAHNGPKNVVENAIRKPASQNSQNSQDQYPSQLPPHLQSNYYYTNKLGAFSQQSYNTANVLMHLPHIYSLLVDKFLLQPFSTLLTLITVLIITITHLSKENYGVFVIVLFILFPTAYFFLILKHKLKHLSNNFSISLFRPALSTLLYDYFYNTATISTLISYNLQFPLFYRSLLLLNNICKRTIVKFIILNTFLTIPILIFFLIPIFLLFQFYPRFPAIQTLILQFLNNETEIVQLPNGSTTTVFKTLLTPELMNDVVSTINSLSLNFRMALIMIGIALPLFIGVISPFVNLFNLYLPFINSVLRYIDMAAWLQAKRTVGVNTLQLGLKLDPK